MRTMRDAMPVHLHSLGRDMMPSTLHIDDEQWPVFVSDARLFRSIYIMSLVLLCYDYVLTFDQEIEYFWNFQTLAWRHVLFGLLRYFSLANFLLANIILSFQAPSIRVSTITAQTCHNVLNAYHMKLCSTWYHLWVGVGFVTSTATHIILVLRIYAMYDSNRRLLAALLSLLVAKSIVELTILYIVTTKMQTVEFPPPITAGCFAVNSLTYAWSYWFSLLTFESSLGILALIKCVQCAGDPSTTPQLMIVLLRDSFIFFGGMLAVALINCTVWAFARPSLFTAFPSLTLSLGSVLGCRILFNMQRVAYRQKDDFEVDTMSDLCFARLGESNVARE
ncbi:unnamed protein product [Somion occarium]|uniref:DUF6533 domain-containing protein n=1 Tax=Somion occarium TaxID=3059160 RepID=A0ABP1CET2_9APHY